MSAVTVTSYAHYVYELWLRLIDALIHFSLSSFCSYPHNLDKIQRRFRSCFFHMSSTNLLSFCSNSFLFNLFSRTYLQLHSYLFPITIESTKYSTLLLTWYLLSLQWFEFCILSPKAFCHHCCPGSQFSHLCLEILQPIYLDFLFPNQLPAIFVVQDLNSNLCPRTLT